MAHEPQGGPRATPPLWWQSGCHFSVTVIGNAGLYCTYASLPSFASAFSTTIRVPSSLLFRGLNASLP